MVLLVRVAITEQRVQQKLWQPKAVSIVEGDVHGRSEALGCEGGLHTAEGAAEAVAAGGGVHGPHRGQSECGPRIFMPDFDFRKTLTCLMLEDPCF
jgi:hypothetical protein